MAWDAEKCKLNGYPSNFTDDDARAVIAAANFANAVYVNISAKKSRTKQAYTYVTGRGWRICVVGHCHLTRYKGFSGPGNCFIPGYADFEQLATAAQAKQIFDLATGGVFPGPKRYPHPLNPPAEPPKTL